MRLLFIAGLLLLVTAFRAFSIGPFPPRAAEALVPVAGASLGLVLAILGRRRSYYCVHCGSRVGDTWNGAYACQRCGRLVCSLQRPGYRRRVHRRA